LATTGCFEEAEGLTQASQHSKVVTIKVIAFIKGCSRHQFGLVVLDDRLGDLQAKPDLLVAPADGVVAAWAELGLL